MNQGDGQRFVAVLLAGPWEDHLELAGDGLLHALLQGADGAKDAARQASERLRDRAWTGDEELADQLDARLGERPAPLLRLLAADLEELAMILEGDPLQGGGRIDRRTGHVWPQPAIDYAVEQGEIDPDDEDPARWLTVWCEGSRAGYHDMVAFIDTVSDEDKADRLSIAVAGRGAFRRFKDVLSRWPDDFTRWHVFADERQRGRARAWLADAGYTPR